MAEEIKNEETKVEETQEQESSSDFLATDKNASFLEEDAGDSSKSKTDSKLDKALNESGTGEDSTSKSSINIGSEEKPDSEDISEDLVGTSSDELKFSNIQTQTTTEEGSTSNVENDENSSQVNSSQDYSIGSDDIISEEEIVEEAAESDSTNILRDNIENSSSTIETQPIESASTQQSTQEITSTEEITEGEEEVLSEEVEQLETNIFEEGENLLPGSISISEPQLITSDEDEVIDLLINPEIVNIVESTIEVTISGLPEGATLSAGVLNEDGSYTLSYADLSNLKLTPPEDSDVDFTLSVSINGNDELGIKREGGLEVEIDLNAIADAPTLSIEDSAGFEDSAIDINITSLLTDMDGSETLSVLINGVPEGATLSAGTNNGDGTWTLNQNELSGLTITPPEDSHEDFTLNVTATATDSNGDTESTSGLLFVDINAVADMPILIINDSAGLEDREINLDITSGLTDLDGSESLSVVISDVPAGASLSAGTDNGDGTWTLTEAQLENLTITPPADSDVDFNLT
ncbi:MAG: cadherin-like domain-containing protein, partial [Bdellovibrionales bacterium]|nr:cadherin-like domain-containing protein [Bdellovibrionales bacterium]